MSIKTKQRAAIYARYSTDNQRESSITEQVKACRDYAKKSGLVIASEFSDPAISGFSFANRPGVQKLRAGALAREFDVILVLDLSRLSRSQADTATFMDTMRFRQVQVIGVQDGFDSTTRAARMQAGLAGIMGEEYRQAVADRTHLALAARAQSGRPTGNYAYGYTLKDVIVPAQAKIVREIFKRAAAGETMKAIVCALNGRNVPGPHAGGRWQFSGIQAILKNETYIGRKIWNRVKVIKDPETGRRVQRPRPREEWIITERPELVLIDRKTWDAVAAIFARRKGTSGPRGGRRSQYPLSGLLECGICGGKLIASGGNQSVGGHANTSTRRYICSRRHRLGPAACANSVRIRRNEVEDRIIGDLSKTLFAPKQIAIAIKEMRKLIASQPKAEKGAAATADIDAKIAKVKAQLKQGLLDQDDADTLLSKHTATRAAIIREAERTAAVPMLPGHKGLEEQYRAAAAEMQAALTGDDADAARAVLMQVYGDRIAVTPTKDGRNAIAEVTVRRHAVLAATGSSYAGRIQLNNGSLLCGCIPLKG
jgi:DNA invertase Pin-like site-specific DNA recombinase